MSKYFIEVYDNDLITINEEKYVIQKMYCLQDPNSTEEKFLEFDNLETAMNWVHDNIKTEYISPFWLRQFTAKPYGQRKYFK